MNYLLSTDLAVNVVATNQLPHGLLRDGGCEGSDKPILVEGDASPNANKLHPLLLVELEVESVNKILGPEMYSKLYF